MLDQYLFKVFAVVLIVLNAWLAVWFITFKVAISKLKKKEKAYVNLFRDSKKSNFENNKKSFEFVKFYLNIVECYSSKL
jgi:hypothetical protein